MEIKINESYDKSIIPSLVELIEELDSIVKQSIDCNVHAVVEFCQNRIVEVLLANGCSKIEESTLFDSLCHTVKPFAIIGNGTEIHSYLRDGIIYKGKILLKAIVKIKE